MNIDKTFKSNYYCDNLPELPNRKVERYYFSESVSTHGTDGLIVNIFPDNGEEWVGIFAYGKVSRLGITGLYSLPKSSSLGVIAKGEGYIVNVHDPRDFMKILVLPVIGVVPVPARELVLFYDFVKIVAIGKKGIEWKSSRLSSDGLRIEEVRDETVSVCGWDAPTQKEVFFEVQLDTGRIK